jgi:hypothetical protein
MTTMPPAGITAVTPATTSSIEISDKTYVSIKRCPNAVATGTLHDPYTNATVAFVRGAQVGAAVQIDHIVSAAVTRPDCVHAGPHVYDMPLTVPGIMA